MTHCDVLSRPHLFDRIVIVGWSDADAPTRGDNSIWRASIEVTTGETQCVNHATRHLATRALVEEMGHTSGRKVFLGFDFPLGFPRGFARRLVGETANWRAVWTAVDGAVTDAPDNTNNRYAAGAALNSRAGMSPGPFWGCPAGEEHGSVKPDKPRTFAGLSEYRIAEGLNADKISSPGGHRWAAGSVRTILRREKYIGSMVWNQTSQKLKTPRRHNPPEKWVLTPEAFDGIISQEQFARAQQIMEERRRKYDPDRLLEKLDALRKEYDLVSSSLLRSQEDMAGPSTYSRYFGSLDLAFQQLFPTVRNEARRHVQERICEQVPEVLPYSDFLVLDQKLTVAIQPAVPVTWGYSAYWPIRRDGRQVVDVTLGVLLGDSEQVDILGYVVLPRWIVGESTIRFSCTSIRTELFGRTDLGFLDQWLGEVTHG